MSTAAENNKRIAKNTLFLYIRMLFTMAIGLFTSRVILQTLGVEDYGTYGVVGGITATLSTLTGSLGAASSRFITFELGLGDKVRMKRIFGNILSIHLVLGLILFVLCQTIGLWFLFNKIQLPAGRENAAFWVYQFSILSAVMGIVAAPYNATIIANERMSAFAYISILNAILKLVIVFLLVVIPFDKLIIYAALYLSTQIIELSLYVVYSIKHFDETHTKLQFDRKLFKEMAVYVGWVFNGTLAAIGFTEGLNILINLFFGTVVNAARAVAVTVHNIINNFSTTFQTAASPQITKSYAQGNFAYMHRLIITSSKFSYYLLLFLSLPTMLEADLLLHWWLGVVPEYTVIFVRLMLAISMCRVLSYPIIASVHATGRLKKFQLIEANMLLAILPIAYLLLKYWHATPESVFVVHLVIESLTQIVRIRIVLPMIKMSVMQYVKEVYVPILLTTGIAVALPVFVYWKMEQNLVSFFVVGVLSVISVMLSTYFVGCSTSEQLFVQHKIVVFINKLKKKR